MWAERLARWGVLVVVMAGVAAVASGLLLFVWSPDLPAVPPEETCTEEPCFDFDTGGLSPLAILAMGAHFLFLGVALTLGGLSLLLSLLAVVRGRGVQVLAVGAFAVAGPLLVLIGGEVLPHLLNPCVLPELAGAEPPGFCARTPEGIDVPDDWHALYHAFIGFLPLSLIVAWWSRRRRIAVR